MNLKTKSLLSVSLILLTVSSVVGYGIMGSGMIIGNAAHVENISYPALNKAIHLEEIVKETKKTIFDAIYEDNSEILDGVNILSDDFNNTIEELIALEPDSELVDIKEKYNEYQSFGREAVHDYIVKGETNNIQEKAKSLSEKAESIINKINTYRTKKYNDFKFSLKNIQKQSTTFKSAFAIAGIISIFIVLFTIIQTQKIFRRIGDVVNDAKILAKGNIDRVISNTDTDEIGVLKNAFEIMRTSLKDHITNLDKKVQKRTEQLEQSKTEITSILNSIEQGIFTFNPDLSVNESHSLKAEEIFNTTNFKDSKLSQLMGASEKDLENLTQWTGMVTQLLFAERQWKKYARLAPIQEIKEIIEGKEHIIKVDYKLIKEGKDRSKIMVLASDITEQRRAEKELEESEKENNLVTSRVMAIINHPAEEVGEFISTTKDILNKMSPLAPKEILAGKDKLFRETHTQKGHGGTLGFDELALHLGIIENNLSGLDRNLDEIERIWKPTIHHALIELKKITKLKNKFRSTDNENTMQVPQTLYQRLTQVIDTDSPLNRVEISTAVHNLNSKRFDGYSKKYQKLIDKYCEEYDKDIAPLKIEGGKEYLNNDIIKRIDGAIVHLIRNAMDHGIEEDEIRFSRKKPQGQITMSYAMTNNWHIFNISDNGGGIDPKTISNKAVEKSLLTTADTEGMQDHDKIQLIFMPGFSTKDGVSEISGRGVGMDAVKSIVEDLNGSIEVSSTLGEGSSFLIQVPV